MEAGLEVCMTAPEIITLPYPPSVNRYWRNWQGRTVISAEGRRYRDTVGTRIRLMRVTTFEGPVALQVDVYPPDRRKRDLDNVLKAILDALEKGGAFRDDAQVVDLHALKLPPRPGGEVLVRIDEAEAV